MPRIKVKVTIDAPPDKVWADLADISSHVEWMRDATAIRFLSDQTRGVGTVFECDTRVGPIRLVDLMVVTKWVPGRQMSVVHTGLISGRGRFTLSRRFGGRTRFVWQERLIFPWWLGGPMGAFAARPVLKWLWRQNLKALKSRLERKGLARLTRRAA